MNSSTLRARLPSARLSARVTDFVAPNVGTYAECLPAPPMTAMMMSSALHRRHRRFLGRVGVAILEVDEETPLDVLLREAEERQVRALLQEALGVGFGEPAIGD